MGFDTAIGNNYVGNNRPDIALCYDCYIIIIELKYNEDVLYWLP